MICPECHRDNPPGNRFCGSCGVKLQPAEGKVDPNAPSVTWLKSMEERELGGATEAERVTRQREMAERAERAALRERELAVRAQAEREAQRASSSPEKSEESNNRTRSVGAPSFLGLNEDYDQAPEGDSAEYEARDIYGGGRSYSRALLLLVVLMVVGGLVFLQWRYSNGLNASPPVEKPSATQPNEASSENPEAKQEDALAQKNEADSAKPENDAAADAQDEAKPAPNSHEAKKSSSNAQPSGKDEAKKPAKAAGQEPKASNADQQESAVGEAEEPATDETAQESKPATKPSPRTRAQREQIPEVSDEPVRLAESYLLGRGLPQSCPQAVSILREAANRGNYKAQIKLGALYATGNCVSQDRVQAYRFFTRALQGKPGNTWVEQNRSMLWAHMNDQERRLAMEHSF